MSICCPALFGSVYFAIYLIYTSIFELVIQKVASAWSRSNLPPPELDTMFRGVEAIYKANRSFFAKLKEIGQKPSSPRAIGDLLMLWVSALPFYV